MWAHSENRFVCRFCPGAGSSPGCGSSWVNVPSWCVSHISNAGLASSHWAAEMNDLSERVGTD